MARVLLLGGLDPSGGAGVTLDAAVVAARGVEPLPIVVANTVQSRRGFVALEPVAARFWRRQVDAVLGDGPVQAVKIGLLGDAALAREVAGVLAVCDDVPVVIDPVLGATAGGLGVDPGLLQVYRERLLPAAALVTPNLPELQLLAAGDARALLAAGAGAALVKGGHGDGAYAVDELWSCGEVVRWRRPRRDCGPVRGTGCALASAIAALLAGGAALDVACREAGDWLAARLAKVRPASDGLPRQLPITDRQPRSNSDAISSR